MKSQIKQILSLVVVLTMVTLMLVGCITIQPSGNQNNSNENQNQDGGNSNNQPTDTPSGCTHDNIITDPAVAPTHSSTGLSEGAHCGTCGNIIVKQEIIPALQAGYYSLTFNNLKGAATPNINRYLETQGLSVTEMPTPTVEGYEFLGWFTASVGGELVDYIPAGSNKNYVLFAHWKATEYSIIYNDAPINNNRTTYTIEDEVVLSSPVWSGLSFSHWEDKGGNKVTGISKGTTGNIELTAHWISMENLVVPSNDNGYTAIYDDVAERYHFIVNLGTINNVVLGTLGNARGKLLGQELNWEISETVSFEEGIANEVAKTITNSVTKSNEWSETKEWAREESTSESANVTAGIEAEYCGVKASVEASLGITETVGKSWSNTTYKGGNDQVGEEEANSTSSTVSYKTDTSTTVNISTTTAAEMPEGTYRYVYAGTVHVFAIVTYEPKTGNYHLDIYSHMDESITEMLLYSPSSDSKVNITQNDTIAYNIPKEDLINYINSSYYVKYDANGGEGNMPLSIMNVDIECCLYENAFTKTGYTFSGWALPSANEVCFEDGQAVNNIAERGTTITLTALWTPNIYNIKYDSNGGKGEIESTTHTYDKDSSLTSSTFTKLGIHSKNGTRPQMVPELHIHPAQL